MEPGTNRNLILAVAVAAAAMIFGLCACCAVGGIAATIMARRAAPVAERLEVAPVVPELPELAPLPTPEMPEQPVVPELPQIPQGLSLGAYIREVVAGSPADEAGLRVGDIVLQVDDVSLTGVGADRLTDVIATYRPGETIMLGVIRGELPREIEVTLGEHPDDASQPYLGVRYADLANGQAPAPGD